MTVLVIKNGLMVLMFFMKHFEWPCCSNVLYKYISQITITVKVSGFNILFDGVSKAIYGIFNIIA